MVNFDSYLEPPDYGDGEMSVTETVYCKNENCDDFEVEVEWSDTASWYGSSRSSFTLYLEYPCPKCKETSAHEFERDNDYYEDPDAWGDRMRDEGY
jgi:hypothetical protein